MRLRMYGSTDMYAFLTRTSPSAGLGTSVSASSKSLSFGAPVGRAASLISRFRSPISTRMLLTAFLVAPPEGQAHDALRIVVRLVRLEDMVVRVGPRHVREAAVEPGHVDPLLVVGGGIDIGPADRRSERHRRLVWVLVAPWKDPTLGRARARSRPLQVAQAVVDLGAGAHELLAMPCVVE